jgi:hypothetical protein
MKKLLFCLLPLSALLAPPAHANLSIHPMRAAVDGKRGTQIRVYSHSTQPQYVQARLRASRILRRLARKRWEWRRPTPRSPSPLGSSTSGGGNRLDPGDSATRRGEEAAYRVYFEGVRGPDGTLLEGDEQAAQANVGVSLVWGALVNVLPTNGSVDLQLQGDTLRNVGTLRVGITGLAECSASGACTTHDFAKSLYPDAELKLPFQLNRATPCSCITACPGRLPRAHNHPGAERLNVLAPRCSRGLIFDVLLRKEHEPYLSSYLEQCKAVLGGRGRAGSSAWKATKRLDSSSRDRTDCLHRLAGAAGSECGSRCRLFG